MKQWKKIIGITATTMTLGVASAQLSIAGQSTQSNAGYWNPGAGALVVGHNHQAKNGVAHHGHQQAKHHASHQVIGFGGDGTDHVNLEVRSTKSRAQVMKELEAFRAAHPNEAAFGDGTYMVHNERSAQHGLMGAGKSRADVMKELQQYQSKHPNALNFGDGTYGG